MAKRIWPAGQGATILFVLLGTWPGGQGLTAFRASFLAFSSGLQGFTGLRVHGESVAGGFVHGSFLYPAGNIHETVGIGPMRFGSLDTDGLSHGSCLCIATCCGSVGGIDLRLRATRLMVPLSVVLALLLMVPGGSVGGLYFGYIGIKGS